MSKNEVFEKFDKLWPLFDFYCKNVQKYMMVPNKGDIKTWINFCLWLTEQMIQKHETPKENETVVEPKIPEGADD